MSCDLSVLRSVPPKIILSNQSKIGHRIRFQELHQIPGISCYLSIFNEKHFISLQLKSDLKVEFCAIVIWLGNSKTPICIVSKAKRSVHGQMKKIMEGWNMSLSIDMFCCDPLPMMFARTLKKKWFFMKKKRLWAYQWT